MKKNAAINKDANKINSKGDSPDKQKKTVVIN